MPDPAAVDNASYMDAINYFCEMEFERETERLRGNNNVPMKVEQKLTPEGEKNTVLVLPKIQRLVIQDSRYFYFLHETDCYNEEGGHL